MTDWSIKSELLIHWLLFFVPWMQHKCSIFSAISKIILFVQNSHNTRPGLRRGTQFKSNEEFEKRLIIIINYKLIRAKNK